MDELTSKELTMLVSFVRVRLKHEAKRPSKVINGVDVQQLKVLELATILEKLEGEMNKR